jgi:nicotinate-nucleotide adenylyltransferase
LPSEPRPHETAPNRNPANIGAKGFCYYFGTFNPIHSGHLMIAQAALCQYGAELGFQGVAFIPSGNPPHREHESDMLPARHRLNMVRLATASNPAFRVSDIELCRSGRSYTIETLRLLMGQGVAQAPVPMIIGADALAGLATWHEPLALAETACFLQAPRPGYPFVSAVHIHGREIPLNTCEIEMPPLSISSTWIRDRLRGDPSGCARLRYFLPEPVRQYIRDNGLGFQ